MENLSHALDHLGGLGWLAAAAARLAGAQRFDGLGDDDLLAVLARIEEVGRAVDGLRVRAAAELAERSRTELGSERLSWKRGCRTASELLQRVTLVSRTTADARLRLGTALRSGQTMTGSPVPSSFPAVARAMTLGLIGTDSATAILRILQPIVGRADPAGIEAAQSELVAAACGGGDGGEGRGFDGGGFDSGGGDDGLAVRCTADQTRLQAQVRQELLDPDGAEPSEDAAMRRRGFTLGTARDGVIPISGALMPEIAGTLRKLFDAHLSPRRADGDSLAAEHPAQRDSRFTAQQRHDALASIIGLATRAAESPTVAGAPPSVIVTVRQSDLERSSAGAGAAKDAGFNGAALHGAGNRGVGHLDREDSPISLRTVQQRICDGGTRLATLDNNGRIIGIGSPQRCFTPRQRIAITVRDGGCLIPGCQIPSSWCEIHHVDPAANGGPTHTDNGVLLCWFHHRTIDSSGWRIDMMKGSPRIKAPPWLEPDSPWRSATKSPTRLRDALEDRLRSHSRTPSANLTREPHPRSSSVNPSLPYDLL